MRCCFCLIVSQCVRACTRFQVGVNEWFVSLTGSPPSDLKWNQTPEKNPVLLISVHLSGQCHWFPIITDPYLVVRPPPTKPYRKDSSSNKWWLWITPGTMFKNNSILCSEWFCVSLLQQTAELNKLPMFIFVCFHGRPKMAPCMTQHIKTKFTVDSSVWYSQLSCKVCMWNCSLTPSWMCCFVFCAFVWVLRDVSNTAVSDVKWRQLSDALSTTAEVMLKTTGELTAPGQ